MVVDHASMSSRIIRWMIWRILASVCGGMLLALTVAALLEARVAWLHEWDAAGLAARCHGKTFWFQWRHVWMVGSAIGFLLPNCRLPPWLTHVALGGLLGIPIGWFCVSLIDSFLTSIAVNRAYAPFAEVRFPENCVDCHPPLSYQKFYPSVYRHLFWRGVFGGLGVGVLLSIAWHTTATRRRLFVVIAALLGVGVLWESWNVATHELNDYVTRTQRRLGQQAGHQQ